MNIQSVVVTNRGTFKFYRVESPLGERPRLELVEELRLPEAHGTFQDQVSDQAGRYRNPNSKALGLPGGASAMQETHREDEIDRRLYQRIAERVAFHLKDQADARWMLIAPQHETGPIKDALAPGIHEQLYQVIGKDLVKTPRGELAEIVFETRRPEAA